MTAGVKLVLPWLLASMALGTAWAQENEPDPQDVRSPQTSDRPSAPAVTGGATVGEEVVPRLQNDAFRGEPSAIPVQLDDDVPLPVQEVILSTPAGDRIAQPASGNPYFLGFAAGAYYPPEGELIDPELIVHAFGPALADERPTNEVYAFVIFQKRMTEERIDQLKSLGVRPLGFHPHYSMKVALPVEQIDRVAGLPFVRWVGTPKIWQKLHPAMAGVLSEAGPTSNIKVWITVFDSDLNENSVAEIVGVPSFVSPGGIEQVTVDNVANLPRRWMSNGWMQAALQNRGVDIRSYTEQTFTFESYVHVDALEQLLELDFVQFIEPQSESGTTSAPLHDESTPMLASDRVRSSFDGSTNNVAIVGHVDTGIDVAHWDLNIWGTGWSCVTANHGDVWADLDGHGSHTAGTILGRGIGSDDYTGNAPGLASWGGDSRIYAVKKYGGDYGCTWSIDTLVSAFQNLTATTPIPHAVSNSWGSWFTDGSAAIGSEYDCRVIDNQVYDYDQAWIFASGNFGSAASTVNIEPSAKNVLTVGSVRDFRSGSEDPGYISGFSSRGPCADGRWKPNVVAPGDSIYSVDSGSSNGYRPSQGTSMACPHVTGVAEQLVDAYSFMRYSPQTIAGWLMASAMTKNGQTISSPGDSHLDTYGTGRIEAYKAMYSAGDMNVIASWSWSASSGSWYPGDFTVPAGTTRLVAVMHYIEPACSSGASQALVSDWDLWLDQDPIDFGAGNTGEWSFQQSAIDNTEIRIIDSPLAGPWRMKAYPDSASGVVKMNVTIYGIYADTTPNGTTTLTSSAPWVKPNQDVTVTAAVYNPDYVASAVFLDTSGSSSTLVSATTTLKDGVVADLTDNVHSGREILLGDIYNGSTRTAEWVVRYSTEGVKNFVVDSRSENWVDELDSINITVDGTPPPLVTNLGSSTHSTGSWSNDPTITFTWTKPTDPLSGLSGYGIYETLGAAGEPGETQDIGDVQSYATSYSSNAQGRYFNIKPVDNVGNWHADYSWTGPYYIDTINPGTPPGLTSLTHTVGEFSCTNSVTMDWNPSSDAHAGVSGYSVLWNHASNSTPDTIVDTTSTIWTTNVPSSSSLWYFHVRARDNAGNWGSASHWGPVEIDYNPPTNYCTAVANSTGMRAEMGYSGTTSVSTNNFRLMADKCPPNKSGLFYYGHNQVQIPVGDGHLCVGGGLVRLGVVSTGSAGRPSKLIDFTNLHNPNGQIYPGDTWNFSFWFRDPAGGPAGYNFADGMTVRFCP